MRARRCQCQDSVAREGRAGRSVAVVVGFPFHSATSTLSGDLENKWEVRWKGRGLASPKP